MRPRSPALPATALAVALPVLLAACGGSPTGGPESQAQAPVAVDTAVAELVATPVWREATGGVEAVRRVAPGTKILGRVDAVPVREGDRVARGDVLVRLESRDLEAAVAQARAALGMAEARLENAAAQEARMEALHARGSATAKAREDATAARRVARAGVDEARAAVAAAEVTLGYATVVSPLDGWVVERRVEAGDMATPGTPLVVVEDLSRVEVALAVPETDVVGLAAGDAARVSVLGVERPGTIARVLPAGDPASRTFRVEVTLANPDGALKSGMWATARFAGGERRALWLPAAALVRRGQLDGVFVVGDDGRARLRWVTLGRGEDGRVEVLSGLAAGERFVVAPPAGLADADTVEVRS